MKENRNWSEEEDRVLRQLREDRGIKKWSQIARILDTQFQIKGKSGKRCRERYYNHVSSHVRRDDWTIEEQNTLFKLHNQKGNKWVLIAQQLERPDNAIKNHYHSKLRKALRKINKIIYEHLRGEFKPIKNSILPKIIQTAEEYYLQADKEQSTPSRNCYVMKNRILGYLSTDESATTPKDAAELREFVKEMNYFNKTYKKRRNIRESVERTRCSLYKGKQILNLIHENQKIKGSRMGEGKPLVGMGFGEGDGSLSISGEESILEDSQQNQPSKICKERATIASLDVACPITEQHLSPPLQTSAIFPYPQQSTVPLMMLNSFYPLHLQPQVQYPCYLGSGYGCFTFQF